MSNSDEEFVPEEEAEEGPAAVKKLREKLKKTVGEKQEYLEGWQRARADFANFKREEAVREETGEAPMLPSGQGTAMPQPQYLSGNFWTVSKKSASSAWAPPAKSSIPRGTRRWAGAKLPTRKKTTPLCR